MVVPFPAVRVAEAKELRVEIEIGPAGLASIEVRAVGRSHRLPATAAECWKGRADRIQQGASWRAKLAISDQCYLVSHLEGLTCSADVAIAMVCLRTGEEIRPFHVEF